MEQKVRESSVDKFFNDYKIIVATHESQLFEKFKRDAISEHQQHRPIMLDCVTYDLLIDDVAYQAALNNGADYIVTSNLYHIGKPNHILYDCKLYQTFFYLEREMYFEDLLKKGLSFLRLKNFTFLANHIRFERLEIFDWLYKKGILNNGIVNMPNLNGVSEEEIDYCLRNEQKEEYLKYNYDFLPINADLVPKKSFTEDAKHQKWYGEEKGWSDVDDYGESYNPMLYLNSYFEILSETYYYIQDMRLDKGRTVNQISEKTLKPILHCLPHFCLTQSNYYKKLEEFGLSFKSKIFKSVWEFDSMEAGTEKTKKFLEANEWLFNLSRKELHELYVDAFPELNNNKKILMKNFKLTIPKREII